MSKEEARCRSVLCCRRNLAGLVDSLFLNHPIPRLRNSVLKNRFPNADRNTFRASEGKYAEASIKHILS